MGLGQFSGSKAKFTYTSDSGAKYVMTLDTDLVLTNSGLTVFNATADAGATSPPKGFRPRVVFWQGTAEGFEGKRKALVAGTPASALYAAGAPAVVTVDGVAGVTTGKKGERQRFI